MRTEIRSEHWNDANGNPAGGTTYGRGFAISWQNGPMGRCTCLGGPFRMNNMHNEGCEQREPNGAFVEDVIAAAADRLRYYQNGKFACRRNGIALEYLETALEELSARTKDREAREVEGTHKE